MKKKLAILLSLAMVMTFALAACGSGGGSNEDLSDSKYVGTWKADSASFAGESDKLDDVITLTLNGDGSTNAFATVMGDATLYSKAEAKDAYENANHWSSFKTLAVFENVPCAQPTFTLENFRLTMKSNTEGATIYYTTDDSEPTTQSLKYTAPIPLLQNDTIRAIAVAEGYSPSVVSDFRKADYKMDVPTVSLSDDLVMTITYGGATEGLTPVHIYYRENTSNSYWYEKPWVLYEGPVQLTKPRYYRVMAQRDGWLDSDESETYDYNTDYRLDAPQMRWTKDETTGIGTMTLSYYSNNSEGDFYYTLDGTEPTKENGTLYKEKKKIDGWITSGIV